MLIHLLIENLMLIERAQISLENSFVAITGESGSGKSSLMEALKIALGAKTSSEMIRRGEGSGLVRASFDLSQLDSATRGRLQSLFEEGAIDWDDQQPLIIQRHLSQTRSSRALIGQTPVSQALLNRIGQELVEVVDSGASSSLEDLQTHLECLDAFAGTEETRNRLQSSWSNYQEGEQKRRQLLALLHTSESRRQLLEFQIEEIETAQLREGEEQELEESYRRVNQSEQLLEALNQLQGELASPCFKKISRLLSSVEKYAQGWSTGENLLISLKGALIQAQEAQELIEETREAMTNSCDDALSLTQRLDLIHRIKKKYGPSLEQIQSFLERSRAQLQELETAQQTCDELEAQNAQWRLQCEALAQELSTRRRVAAQELASSVVDVLRSLNMPGAEFTIQLLEKEMGPHGFDSVEFFMCPNPGEPSLSVRRFASGGEMARLFLTLKTLKAHKRIPPTLVFDEIDASIGGQSASRVADKLLLLSQNRQVLCITHFAQVAEKAQVHIAMEKSILEGRTLTKLRVLQTKSEKQLEIKRMQGGERTKH